MHDHGCVYNHNHNRILTPLLLLPLVQPLTAAPATTAATNLVPLSVSLLLGMPLPISLTLFRGESFRGESGLTPIRNTIQGRIWSYPYP